MEPQQTTTIMTPIIQYGFAGFCGILLVILVWLISQLLKILKENNVVISTNTQAIQAVSSLTKSTFDVSVECKDKLLQRPCIAKFKVDE